MLTNINVMRDPHATKDIVAHEIWGSLEPDPQIVALEQECEQPKAGRFKYRDTESAEQIMMLGKQIRAIRAQRMKNNRRQHREYYFINRPT